jgi:enterochelin esterase-like enzyme
MLNSISKGKRISVILWLIIMFALVSLGPSGMATATVPTKSQTATTLNSPTVLPDGQVTFTLNAPQATNVMLNFQNIVGPSPAADPIAMTKNASGVWSVTIGPLAPNWYGYGFILDGVKIPDPANRNIWSGPTSAWSYVFVPGPEAYYMADASVPHGIWGTVRYYSEVAQAERQMQVYTPPGYNHDNRRYPVFYLLQGGGGNDTDWIVNMRANYIMDNLIAQNKVVPMIVVMPDIFVVPSGYTQVFDDELLGSIIPAIEQNYRVAPGAENRALAGLSLGGLTTSNVLFTNPGEFAYIGNFSGYMIPSVVQYPAPELADQINKETKLFWITVGGPQDISYTLIHNMLTRLDELNINYTFVQGTGGHVWDVWRHNLFDFAQLIFR